MARLAAEAKLCYYPIHPDILPILIPHLKMPARPEMVTIMDPCAGKGAALKQLAEGMGVKPGRVYGIELDTGRSKELQDNLPEANVLASCSFHGAEIARLSFSLIYINPPFGDELGGGRREEEGFLSRVVDLLVPGGILVMVAPQKVFIDNWHMPQSIGEHFSDGKLYRFPDELRPYGECVYIGVRDEVSETGYKKYKRTDRETVYGCNTTGTVLPHLREINRTWDVPTAWKPYSFKKVHLTDDEMDEAIEVSPLNRILLAPPPAVKPRPPLPLRSGQVALLVMSGQLDGVVQPPDEPPHVVRGSSRKETFLAEVQVNKTDSGTTTKHIYSQRVIPVLRAVGQDGIIYSMEEIAKKEVEEGELEEMEVASGEM